MENFNLRKFLAENSIKEVAGKVLIDKTEPRWVIVGEDGTIPKYFEKNLYTSSKRAQDALDGMMKSHEEYVDRELSSNPNSDRSDYKMPEVKVQEVELKMTVTAK
jgi:hypothetical protein